MSLADTADVAFAPVAVRRRRNAFGRQMASELRLVFGRRRNQFLLVALGAIPLLIGIAFKVSSDSHGGPAFVGQITTNGLFLVLTSLIVTLNLALPVVVGIVAADAVAGEAQTGTLRYLLAIPVGRGRLLAVKSVGIAGYAAAAVAVIAIVGGITGLAFFGTGTFTLLGGESVSVWEGLLRVAAVGIYVWLSLFGLLAVGLLISTLTEVPIAAMAGTIGFAVVSLVLNSVPELSAIHPALVNAHWESFGTLLRVGPDYGQLLGYLMLQVVYVAVAGSLAWARFSNADVTA